jgi:predicted nuclease of restriction endonuclease-like (RecB) superfamily
MKHKYIKDSKELQAPHIQDLDKTLTKRNFHVPLDLNVAKASLEVNTQADLDQIYEKVRSLILSARSAAAKNINTLQVLSNFRIGNLIIEHEQKGKKRAEYGKKLLIDLSSRLTQEFGSGFSLTNLKLMRQFYILYNNRIGQTLSDQLQPAKKSQTPSDLLRKHTGERDISEFSNSLILGWSHYVFLLGVKDLAERRFYEIEAARQNWGVRELKRQFNAGLYERLALSRNKEEIKKLSYQGQVIEKPQDIIKNPLVLEFLGLSEKNEYSERDLETAIIDKIERFLLELGKGFLFEARQKRFSFDDENFFVDLVFYNRLLKCYVLVDLKIGKLTHQDLGQMQMYVNYYDRYIKTKSEESSIGIILCKEKNDALVEITLPKESNIFASQYQFYLPSKEELKQKLLEWTNEAEGERK